jgi:hypothetical protein
MPCLNRAIQGNNQFKRISNVAKKFRTYTTAICVNVKRMIKLIYICVSPPKIYLRRVTTYKYYKLTFSTVSILQLKQRDFQAPAQGLAGQQLFFTPGKLIAGMVFILRKNRRGTG